MKNFKKSENLKKIPKNHYFSKNMKIFKIFFFRRKKEEKNAILLVFQYKEDPTRPELSTSPRFRIQGGYPERYGQSTEILVSNIRCMIPFH